MTFSMLGDIQDQTDSAALWRLVLDYFHDHGVEKISYHHFSTDLRTDQSVTINTDGFSREWVCQYIERKLYLVDPITELAQSATRPFRWSDIENLMRLTPEQKEYLCQMHDAGVGDGLAYQVFGPGLRNGYVGLGTGKSHELPLPLVLDFQLVAQAGHLRYCELNPHGVPAARLSPREREILRWMARGESNKGIANRLELSPHTVDTLVRRIFDKLGVADRTTAAIRGMGAGLIVP
ncbi:LuxR family transcriptional regulator [uncultured Tateyamaria sp.]|uniref:helix-turn-helix transcriptional regulator n=1 Tax=uncultured Tateyamaria sp. TaxID=455651 RepID=UPI0026050811|nr:LuxR family transcriptional regulator [uncultured Tateyamaria sp.]